MMQRIELMPTVNIARVVIDLEGFFVTQPTTQALMAYFEMNIENGWDTFLLPTAGKVLATVEDVFLQRPYLKRQIQFICRITPIQQESRFVDSQELAIITEATRIYEQLDYPKIAVGLVALNDLLFDPLSTVSGIERLVETETIESFGAMQGSWNQMAMLNYYSEGQMSLCYREWEVDFFFDEAQITALQNQQLFPLVKFSDDQRLRQHEKLEQLANTFQVSKEAIMLAWIFYHPVNVLLVIDASVSNQWRQAYQEQHLFQLTREQWYQLC